MRLDNVKSQKLIDFSSKKFTHLFYIILLITKLQKKYKTRVVKIGISKNIGSKSSIIT